MQELDLQAFEARAAALDRAISKTAGVDPFCSRAVWTTSFHRAFGPDRPLVLYGTDTSSAALARNAHPQIGAYLEPLESMWGFASPLLGPDAIDLLQHMLRGEGARGLPMRP